MGFKCGIVGLPNVGKSTLFNALTQASVPAENYPFCTIDPNVGVVPIPDPRLAQLASLVSPEKVVPAVMEFVDIAGLVAGASKGEGRGNQFLAHIREVDAIAHVVRCFKDDNVTHVANKIDPIADIETINTELILADIDTVTRALNRTQKAAKSGDKTLRKQYAQLERIHAHLNQGERLARLSLDQDELDLARSLCLLTMKPTLYVANVHEEGFKDNPWLERVEAYAHEESAETIPICASLEAQLVGMTDEEKGAFLTDVGLEEPGLNRLIRAGYRLLGLHTFFTAGPKETRAWTIHQHDSACAAAGKIHSDIARGFIRAETIAFDDYMQYKGENGAREAGKLRLEGKEYEVKDGDVIYFRFNV